MDQPERRRLQVLVTAFFKNGFCAVIFSNITAIKHRFCIMVYIGETVDNSFIILLGTLGCTIQKSSQQHKLPDTSSCTHTKRPTNQAMEKLL